jgi:hypothetical protein
MIENEYPDSLDLIEYMLLQHLRKRFLPSISLSFVLELPA